MTEILKNYPYKVTYSPDGKLLASYGARGITLWDTATNKVLFTIENQDYINTAVFSPDSNLIATGDSSLVRYGKLKVGNY